MDTLTSEDRQWLLDLDKKIWDRCVDGSGMAHAFPESQRRLETAELERVLDLVLRLRLPCVLHSGTYGGLSMSIHGHSDAPGVPPDRLITIAREHAGLPSGHINWDANFLWFSRFTHRGENRNILDFYGFDPPEDQDRYRY